MSYKRNRKILLENEKILKCMYVEYLSRKLRFEVCMRDECQQIQYLNPCL